MKLNKEIIKLVINNTIELLNKHYIYPEIAKNINKVLNRKLENGNYFKINDSYTLCEDLTNDLRKASNDYHLVVEYYDKKEKDTDNTAKDQLEDYDDELKYDNYGFYKVERMRGNIGYIDLRSFEDTNIAGDKAVNVMNFLSDSYALIFDMRKNTGGKISMIQLLLSYISNNEPEHISTIYHRSNDFYQQFWTLPYINGKRLENFPVYVLISNYTFSAGESFTYILKNRKRALIIGEKTFGAANPMKEMNICEGFVIGMPNRLSFDPLTNKNWEGVGVLPDIEVNSADALKKAHILAIENLIKSNNNMKDRLYNELKILKALYYPVTIDINILKKYVGEYNNRKISIENGNLIYKLSNIKNLKLNLIPLDENLFWNGENLIHFKERNNIVIGIIKETVSGTKSPIIKKNKL